MTLFKIGEETGHHVGDAQCPGCWEEYPEPCRCGGLMHAGGTEDDQGGDVVLVTQCDRCGRSEDQLEEP